MGVVLDYSTKFFWLFPHVRITKDADLAIYIRFRFKVPLVPAVPLVPVVPLVPLVP